MKKAYLLIILIITPILNYGQIFKFTYTGVATCPTPNNTPVVQSNNITVTPLLRQGLNCSATSSSFNSNGWTNSTIIDQNSYIEVTVVSNSGYQINLSSFSFETQKSASGPGLGRIAMDKGDGIFSQSYDFVPTESSQNINWDFDDFTVLSGYTIRFRIYGWQASSGSGTLRLNNVTLSGAVTQQPTSGGSGSSAFTINGSNVGLDKVPTQKLDINGNIRTDGKLFVGNINDAKISTLTDYLLAVNGSAIFTLVNVKLFSSWPDYVFKNGYQLQTLEEVEKHITEKGHLPNVPSAEEVAKNGINVAEMDAKLLEKIEELTLYSIEQNKQIKQQQEQIKQLESQNKEIAELKKLVQDLKEKTNQ